jgi:hypothetical protein
MFTKLDAGFGVSSNACGLGTTGLASVTALVLVVS